jgi:hypothetical protein
MRNGAREMEVAARKVSIGGAASVSVIFSKGDDPGIRGMEKV